MQDKTFDDYDYTLCTKCHSSIQPYNNISLSTITAYNNNIPIPLNKLSSINPYTKNLLTHSHLHCSKCGLYIKIHPSHNTDTTSIQKIFICSNYTSSHKYCLCYHCGLLYGINPNQKTINILSNIPQPIAPKIDHKENMSEECSLGEVIDDKLSSDGSEEFHENKSKIDESYLHLIALQTKLNLLNGSNGENNNTSSCPSSPRMKLKHNKNWPISSSLRGSPLLGPSTPSPRILGKDVDQSEKKWQKYLIQFKKSNNGRRESGDRKFENQQKKLEALQKLQKELSMQKKNSEQYAKLFRNGIYSHKNNVKHATKFKFDV